MEHYIITIARGFGSGGKEIGSKLAKRLGITRSSVNAWEMGISVPSTQYVVEVAGLFGVSTDYLLGVESSVSISAVGLTEEDIRLVHAMVAHLREKNGN